MNTSIYQIYFKLYYFLLFPLLIYPAYVFTRKNVAVTYPRILSGHK